MSNRYSVCGTEFEPDEAVKGVSDTWFDIFCPRCDAGVIPNGEEANRQQKTPKQILTELRELAEETQTSDYEGEQYPIDRLKEDLERLLNDIKSELARRKE